MKKIRLRWVGICLILVMVAGILSGCSTKIAPGENGVMEESDTEGAMGRYLETEVPLPEGVGEVFDMVRLQDGTLRIATDNPEGSATVWNLQGESWEKVYDFPEELRQSDTVYFSKVVLSPKGDGMVDIMEITSQGESAQDTEFVDRCYHLSESGEIEEIPMESADAYIYFCDYTADGELLMEIMGEPLSVLDPVTGELIDKCSGKEDYSYFGAAGKTLYLVDYDGKILFYDLESGDPLPEDTALSDALKQSGADLSLQSEQCRPLLFCEGEEEDEVFFCTEAGLYRHVKGGSVTEQLIDGSLSSLGSPDVGVIALEAAENQEFYVLGIDSTGNHLMHYTYSADVATVPGTELRVYALRENRELAQNISQYQKDNPEVYVNLEVGVTEGGEITASDALRTLSTEIMAGNSPDVLILDGMPMDSYVEQGLLEDLSDVAADAENVFDNLLTAMKQDGKIYGIPMRFSIPLVETKKEYLDEITDLNTLADVAEQMRADNGEIPVVGPYYSGSMLAAQLYNACYPAWLNEDGTIRQTVLEEFYTQLMRIFDKDKHRGEDVNFGIMGISYGEFESSISGNGIELYNDKIQLNFGGINSALDLGQIAAILMEKEDVDYKPFDGQTAGTFQPRYVAGISSKSQYSEEAKAFLRYLLSEEAQSASQAGGLPVNEQALIGKCEAQKESYYVSGTSDDPDSYLEMEVKTPRQEDIERLVAYAKEVTQASFSNTMIRETVLEQADSCTLGDITPKEAAEKVAEQVNLYLAE